jgi:hypothetical protein
MAEIVPSLSGYSEYRCSAEHCRNNGTSECLSCGKHFCDWHMLRTRLEETHIGGITIEACADCTSRAVALYTSQGAYVSSWHRKSSTPTGGPRSQT